MCTVYSDLSLIWNSKFQRDEELKKLRRQRAALVPKATQTSRSSTATGEDGNNDSDGQSPSGQTKNAQAFQRAARKTTIFNEKLDYSHVQSKVDTNIYVGQLKSQLSVASSVRGPSPNSEKETNDKTRDEEVEKLKALLRQVRQYWDRVVLTFLFFYCAHDMCP